MTFYQSRQSAQLTSSKNFSTTANTLSVPDGMAPGNIITVTGIPNNSHGFHINLRVRRDGEIIFQYNPRIKEGCVVRNAQQGGTWTAEERTFEMPFALQRPFTVRIEVAADAYTVRVDDAESTRFSHRRPPAEATFIECGNFKLTKLSFSSGPNEPVSGSPNGSLSSPHTNSVFFGFGERTNGSSSNGGSPFGDSSPGGNFPELWVPPGFPQLSPSGSFGRSLDHFGSLHSDLFAPAGGLGTTLEQRSTFSISRRENIPGGLCPNRKLIVNGIAPPPAETAQINLSCSRSSDIALQVKLVPDAGQLIMNHQRNGVWGEQRTGRYAKCSRTQPFAIELKCETGNKINVILNGGYVAEFALHNEHNLHEIDMIEFIDMDVHNFLLL